MFQLTPRDAAVLVFLSLLPLACSAEPGNTPPTVGANAPVAPAVSDPAVADAPPSNPAAPAPREEPTTPVAAPASTSDGTVYWASFRGPEGYGVSSAIGLPETWSDSENVAWKAPLPGAGASTPIVWGDHIYLTAYTGYLVPGESGGSVNDLKRHLICLQATDGKELWRKTVDAKLPEEDRIRDHGYAANSASADASGVVAFFGKSGVIAYNHNGEEVWTADVGSNTNGWGTASSPVLYDDLVFINASVESGALIALDRSTGEERWRARGIKESWNTPVVVPTAKRDELVLAIHGKVLAFDPSSGDPLWNCDTNITWYMVPSIVAADGVVYVLGGRSGVASLAVRCGGQGDVTGTHRLWTSNKGSNVSSPVYSNGHLYWMHDQIGIAYCAKADTGELVYEERMDRAGQVYASALLADGRVYYLNRSGRTFVVAAKPEFEVIATNDLRDGGQFNGSPAVLGDRLLIRSDKFLYCLGR